jgi:hypothetical protein
MMECRFEAGFSEAMSTVAPIRAPVFLFLGAGKIAVPAHPH